MRGPRSVAVVGGLAGLLASGCGGEGGDRAGATEVVLYTSVDQPFSEPIFRGFERETNVRVSALFDTEETKSTGVLNRLIAEADNPRADVFWSGDPARPFLLIERGLVEPYVSPSAARIPARFKAADGSWTGFAARARVFLVNTDRVSEAEMPTSIHDLADPRWRGRTAIANPLFGTTTMHMAALVTAWGADSVRTFLRALGENEVRIASSNGEVRRLVASGEIAFGLTDTDDANEALESGAPVRTVYPDQNGMGTLVMPTVVVLLRDAPHPETGRKLIDHLLSATVERELARSAAHMPLGTEAPEGLHVPDIGRIRAMDVDYARVAEAMERIQPWLREWVGL